MWYIMLFQKLPDRNFKEEGSSADKSTLCLLLRPAGKAAMTILSYSSHCFHCCQVSTTDWWELIKPPEKKNTVLQVGEILFCFSCSGLAIFVWNESRRNRSWLEPQAQMAARHEWGSRLSLPSPLRLTDSMFSMGSHVLKESCFLYSMKIAFCSDWSSTTVLSSVF